MYYDVIIIGAGVIGCLTAYKLSAYNVKAVVLEAEDDVAMGATKANSAIIHAGFDAEPGTLKALLNVRSAAEMPTLAEKLDIEFEQCGTLVAAFGEEEHPQLEALLERGIANGVPDLRIIARDELRRMEPNISPEATAALWAPGSGIISAWGLTIAAAEAAAVNRTDFRFNFRVSAISRSPDGVFTVTDGSQAVAGRYIVNAAGVWGDKIAALAGEKDFPAEIIPRRGEYMLLDRTEGKTVNHVLFSVPSGNGKGILVAPTVHGNLIIGPNAYKIENRDDKSTTPEGLDEILTGAKRLVPSVNHRAVITSFSGVRPTSKNGDYYIKPSEEVKGLLHLAGIESPGLASSPAVGAYAVEKLAAMGLTLEPRRGFVDARPPQPMFSRLDEAGRAELAGSDPSFARIVCRCESVTEGEIVDSIRRPVGARSVDMVKRRTRAGMGRCQGGFCLPRVAAILARELGVPLEEITKKGGGSWLVSGRK